MERRRGGEQPDSDEQPGGGGAALSVPRAPALPAPPPRAGPSPGAAARAPAPPPDGGYGWVCAACVAAVNTHTWGLNASYGVFLAHYLAADGFPGARALDYAFVGSLGIGAALLVSPVATVCVRRLGTRPTMLAGAALEAAGLVAAAARRLWHLVLAQGLLFGLGMGLLFVPSVAVVPQWFARRRSLANGVAACSSGLGGLLYSLVAALALPRLSPTWALCLLGLVALVVNAVCALLLRDCNAAVGSAHRAFDAALLRRPEFLLLLAFGCFSMLAYVVLVFSLTHNAQRAGLSASRAAQVGALLNLGQAVGRPLVDHFSDRTGRINMAALTTLVGGLLCLAVWVNARSYLLFVVFAVVCGAVAGTFWTAVGPVTAEVVGLRRVPSALSLVWLAILLPCLFSEPMALQMVVGTGRYLSVKIFVGLMYVAAALCLVLRGWKIGQMRHTARLADQDPGRLGAAKAESNEDYHAGSRKSGRETMFAYCLKVAKV